MRTRNANSRRSTHPCLASLTLAATVLFAALPGYLAAADQSADYFLTRAINSLTSGNHDAADRHFRSARDAAGDSAKVNLQIGSIYIEYADDGYRRALPYLEASVARATAFGIAHLRLGQAYYQTGDTKRAQQTFTTLLADSQLAPYARYYLGVIALQQRDYERAEAHLTPYIELPPTMRARARFQMARADYEQREYAAARGGFEAILEDLEATQLHSAVKSYLDAIRYATNPWSLYGIATLRYDSNPLVVADDELVGELTGETLRDDFALVLQGQAKLRLQQTPGFESAVSYLLYDLSYDQLSSRNQRGHIIALDGTWFGELADLDIGYAYEYWSLDSDKFQRAQRLSATLTRHFTPDSTTEVGYRYSYVDRYDDRSRTGSRHLFHLRHQLPSIEGWQLDLNYRFRHADTDEVHESLSNELGLELSAPMFHGWYAVLDATYDRTRFPETGDSGHRDRDENWRISGSITRKLTSNLYLQLGACYEKNDSDDPLYDYERYQLDIGLTASF